MMLSPVVTLFSLAAVRDFAPVLSSFFSCGDVAGFGLPLQCSFPVVKDRKIDVHGGTGTKQETIRNDIEAS